MDIVISLVEKTSFFFQFKCTLLFSDPLSYLTAGGRHRGGPGGRGHDSLIGTTVKIRLGPYKGYRGRVKDIKGTTVRVELESQMKEVTGKYLVHWLIAIIVVVSCVDHDA